MKLFVCTTLLLVLAVAIPASVRAQSFSQDAELNAHWDRGGEAFTAGDLEGVVEHQRRCQRRAVEINHAFSTAKCVSQLSFYARALGDFDLSLTTALEAKALFDLTPFDKYEGWMTLGYAYAALNDARRAAEALDQADALQDGRQDGNLLEQAAVQYERAGDFDTAIARYAASARLSDLANAKPALRLRPRARAALLYAQLGRTEKATSALAELERLRRQLNAPYGHQILRALGLAAFALGDRQAALRHLDQGRALVNDQSDLDALRDYGDAYARAGAPAQAIDCYTGALAVSAKAVNPLQSARLRAFRARAERDAGRFDEALTDIAAAIPEFERVRGSVLRPHMRAEYFATLQRHYELYVDVLMHLHSAAPTADFATRAFGVAERARARALREALVDPLESSAAVDPALRAEEERLRRELSRLLERHQQTGNPTRSPADAPFDPARTSVLAKKIVEVQAQYDAVAGKIEAARRGASQSLAPPPLELRHVQNRLPAGTLLLEYMLGERRSYLFVVGSTSFQAFELPPRRLVEEAARALHTALIERPQSGQLTDRTATRTAANLTPLVIGPAAPLLRHVRVVIAADGALHYLPFQLLPPLQRADIAYVPSASLLGIRGEIAHARLAAPRIAIFADPVFSTDDGRVQSATPEAGPATLPRLTFSRREAMAVAARFPAGRVRLATDFGASKAALLDPAIGRFDVVHIATHGIVDTQQPLSSRLVFSQVDATGHRVDGVVTLADVYSMRLSADLVVLSACDTALGRELRGEGLIGLTRGFMHAGARQVLASLWKVDDAATSELMKHFYAEFSTGKPAATALRTAQAKLRAQPRWQHPYFWAGFQLHGDW